MTEAPAPAAATTAPLTPEQERERIERMLAISRRNKLPRLLIALDRLHARAAGGERIDAAALVRLQEIADAAAVEFEAAKPECLDYRRLTDVELRQLNFLLARAAGEAEPAPAEEKPERSRRWFDADDLIAVLDRFAPDGGPPPLWDDLTEADQLELRNAASFMVRPFRLIDLANPEAHGWKWRPYDATVAVGADQGAPGVPVADSASSAAEGSASNNIVPLTARRKAGGDVPVQSVLAIPRLPAGEGHRRFDHPGGSGW
jgi:hypothetical protein